MAKEFEACGVPVRERGARTNEALEVISRLLTEKNVSFEGRFTRLDGITIAPSPIQKPRPPIWVAGRKEAAMKRTARYADGWMPYMYTPEMLAESVGKIAAFSDEVGRAADSVRTGLFVFTCVHEDRTTALELANQQLSLQYNQDFSKMVEKYTVAGSPEDCRRRVQEYIDAGARSVMFAQGCPADHVEENTRLIAEAVMPAFR
jgi:alkanesulfonate monooxygenase SsuD/methylene tetrahydromethanopterin reductase-like flavin-dependent oxidoreductase (luciferase family)